MLALTAVIADLCAAAPEPPGDVTDRDAYDRAGDDARDAGDLRIAAIAYRKALAADATDAHAKEALAALCAAQQPDDTAALADAIALVRRGELESARRLLAPIAARDDGPASGAHFFLGVIALRRHDGERARRELEAARRDPAYAEAAASMLRLAHRDGTFAATLLVEPELDTNPQLVPDTPPAGATIGPPRTDEDALFVGAVTVRPRSWLALRNTLTWRHQRAISSLDFLGETAQVAGELDRGLDHAALRYDLDYDGLAGTRYLLAHRATIAYRHELDAVTLAASYALRRRDYLQAAQAGFTGWVHSGELGVTVHATPRLDVDARAIGWRELTADPAFTSLVGGLQAGVRARISSRFRIAAVGSVWSARYDGAEPDGSLRRDIHGEGSADVEIDLGDHVLAVAGASVEGNHSTIEDFRYWKLVLRAGIAIALGGTMTPRRALAVFAAAAALLLALNALVYSLYRSEVRTVATTLDDRLTALGTTTARWLDTGREADALLAVLVAENHLEDAYTIERSGSAGPRSAAEGGREVSIDGALRVTAGVRTRAGASLNLLRVDQDRLAAALAGHASAGDGYSIANVSVETAYFPIAGGRVLALEAGAEYHAPTSNVRTTYIVSVALSVLVAIVFGVGLGLALRALERARLAHGRAERLAVVGQMAAMVAHEVRNPLGTLRGQVELAREKLSPEAPARERERFAEMIAEIDRINRLTEEFLGLARDVPLDVARVDLGALATAIASELTIVAQSQDVALETDIPAAPIEVAIDAGKVRQAIQNLVLNAVQIGGAGTHVRIEVGAEATRVHVTVSDDGPGVAPAIAATLFEPFVTGRPGGSGLGLAIARRVAERHGGSLVLDAKPGVRGARFSIYLPKEAR